MVRVKQGKVTAEFKRDALRILSTSGRTVADVRPSSLARQVDDLPAHRCEEGRNPG
jgi:hypothetical protein